MFNHHKLKCYVLALDLAKVMPSLLRTWPFYLSDQLKRALTSVILNIAEGNGRMTTKERKRSNRLQQNAGRSPSSRKNVIEVIVNLNRYIVVFGVGILL